MQWLHIDYVVLMRLVAVLASLELLVLCQACVNSRYSEKCDLGAHEKDSYSKYFSAMKTIYGNLYDQTVLDQQKTCGWSSPPKQNPDLPLFVLSVGLEGAGHHLYSSLLKTPVFDCVWVSIYAVLSFFESF